MTRARRALAPALGALALAAALAGCGQRDGAPATAKAAAPPPAIPVSAADVVARDVPIQLRAIGNVQAYATVSVLSLVGGEVTQIHFADGQDVKAGDLLFTIDRRPFEAALQQAEAQRSQHQAQVAQAEANLERDRAQYENAQIEEGRYKKLVDGGFIAREQYDQIRTTEKSLAATIDADRAAVSTAEAAVRADAAAVEAARLQLSYSEIRAPIDARAGSVLIHKGNVVKANDVGNSMVILNRVHPIYVQFAVPEQFLERIKRFRAEGEMAVIAQGPGPGDRPARGELSFVNNTVDMATGSIQLKATFQNADNALWPGQFVNVVMTLNTERGAVVVPTQAVQAGQQGSYVFIVKPDMTVESRPVTPAFTDGPITVIAKGLAPGERVVIDGQMRLVPGARVELRAPASAPTGAKGSSAKGTSG